MGDDVTSATPADKAPLTARGVATKAKLIAAARTIFEINGFSDATITAIARTAGVAYGTFYTYFDTKEEIFREVARDVQREMISERVEAPTAERDRGRGSGRLYDRVERANRMYLSSYERNARLMAVIEHVALTNDELLQIRREVRSAFVDRSTAAISRWQREGLADPELDARYAASALGSMVDRFAYVWFVLDGDFEMEEAIANLTRMWVQALAMTVDTTLPAR